jgi:protein TonB
VAEAQAEPAREPDQALQTQAASASHAQDTAEQESVSGAGGKAGTGQEAAAGSGESASGGGSPGAHPDYFAELRAWLEKHKQYPRRARLRRLEGTATLRFVMDREGRVLSFELTSSSGHDMLDGEVRDMIRRAEPLPALPEEMGRDRIELEVPVRFALR